MPKGTSEVARSVSVYGRRNYATLIHCFSWKVVCEVSRAQIGPFALSVFAFSSLSRKYFLHLHREKNARDFCHKGGGSLKKGFVSFPPMAHCKCLSRLGRRKKKLPCGLHQMRHPPAFHKILCTLTLNVTNQACRIFFCLTHVSLLSLPYGFNDSWIHLSAQ